MYLTEALQSFDTAMVGVVAPRTREWYARRLRSLSEYLGDVELAEIDIADLRAWRASLVEQKHRWKDHPTRPMLNSGLSPWTIAGYVRACRRFFNWLEQEKIIVENPARRLRMPRLPDPDPKGISRVDLEKMLDAARGSPRDYAIIRFLAATGARLSGVAGLRLQDLDLDNLRAEVWEKGGGGTGKSRLVYFGEGTGDAISDYLKVRPAVDSDSVWIGQRGDPLSGAGIYRMLGRVAKRAGVEKGWNPHSFRHAWATFTLEAGADLGTVRQGLGHSSIEVTHRYYGRWADGELGDRVRKYGPLD